MVYSREQYYILHSLNSLAHNVQDKFIREISKNNMVMLPNIPPAIGSYSLVIG